MRRYLALLVTGMLIGVVATIAAQQSRLAPGGYIVEQDAQVASPEPGPHSGGGQTIAYSFFKSTPGLKLVFRKRALKPGSGIGYHQQQEDEIYYVLSGRGQMTLDAAVRHQPDHCHGEVHRYAEPAIDERQPNPDAVQERRDLALRI